MNATERWRNPALYAALRAYTTMVLAKIASGPARTPFGTRWARAKETPEERVFVRVPWFVHRPAFLDTLHGTKEFADCVTALNQDQVMAHHIDVLVGTSAGSFRMEATTYIDHIWRDFDRKQLTFHDSSFDDAYASLESDFYKDYIEVRVVAPLHDFKSPTSIFLQPDLSIEPLNDEDISGLLELGVNIGYRFSEAVYHVPQFAIVYHPKLDKVIGNNGSPRSPFDYREKIEWVLTVMHAYCKSKLVVPGLIMENKSIFGIGRQGMLAPLTDTYHASVPEFDEKSARGFEEFFRTISHNAVQRHTEIAIALRRFHFAAQRKRSEDRLIDLLIAAEALFLPDGGGELRYRLSQRLAFFLHDDPTKRMDVFEDIKKAYDIRSKIVHGKQPEDVKRAGGLVVKVSEFIDKIEEHMRAAIHKAVQAANKAGTASALPNWDQLVMGYKSGETAN